MRKLIPFSLTIIAMHLITTPPLAAQVRIYDLKDWISYKNCNYPTSLSVGNEYIYFGTSGGVVPYHKFGRYFEAPYTVSDGLPADFINAVLFDTQTNYIWAAHDDGISYLSPTAERWQTTSTKSILPENNPVNRLGRDNHYIWAVAPGDYAFKIDKTIGTILEQLGTGELSSHIHWAQTMQDPVPALGDFFANSPYRYENSGVIIDEELREYNINLFHMDKNRNFYGGIWGLGLIEGDAHVNQLNIHSYGPLRNYINALTMVDNTLWMGGMQKSVQSSFTRQGISIFNLKHQEWQYKENHFIHELATYQVTELVSAHNRIWVGTTQGLSIYDRNKETWKRLAVGHGLSDEIVLTIALEDTVAWIGTRLGLSKIFIPPYKAKRVYLTTDQVHHRINKAKTGLKYIWLATENGLYAINRTTQTVSHFDLNGKKIDPSEPVAAEYYMIGGSDSLIVFHAYNSFLKYHVKTQRFESLPNLPVMTNIFDITVVDDYLWIGTAQGAFLVRLKDFYQEHYTTEDGLAGNAVFKIIPDGDIIWFATDQGLTQYHWRKYVH